MDSFLAWKPDLFPGFSPHFRRFANHGLDERYDLPFDSWYGRRLPRGGCP